MGTGGRTDPTTDFFDTHRSQCLTYAEKRRSVPEAAALVATFDASIVLCDAAIASGRRRDDMPSVVAKLHEGLARYEALSTKTKTDLRDAILADVRTRIQP